MLQPADVAAHVNDRLLPKMEDAKERAALSAELRRYLEHAAAVSETAATESGDGGRSALGVFKSSKAIFDV